MQLQNQATLWEWLRYFKQRFGYALPRDYMSVDTETLGFANTDLIWEIGHCIVRDGQPAHRGHYYLDWTRSEYVDQDWLQDKISRVRSVMLANFKPIELTYELLRDKGIPPEQALSYYHQLFSVIRQNRGLFIGANLYNFDNRMLRNHMQEFVGLEWEFGDDEAIDVGALEKARQLELKPFGDESLKAYFRRINGYVAKGVRYNVEHCIDVYGLWNSHQIEHAQCHGAQLDAYVSHLILEQQRTLGEAYGQKAQTARTASRARQPK